MRIPILLALGLCADLSAAPDNLTNSPATAPVPVSVVATPQYINSLAEELRTNNSALWAARARIVAAEENAKSIPLWSDPMVMLGGMASDKAMRSEQGDILYGVEQKLPVFGKERTIQEAAHAGVAVEQAGLEYEFQILRKELVQAVITAALADELLILSREDLTWLETLEETAGRRYAAGTSSQVDLLRAQNEHSRGKQKVFAQENDRHTAFVELNRLLNRGLVSGWAQTRLPEIAGPIPFSELLLKRAVKFEPRLRVMRRELERAEAEVNATSKQSRPDLSAAVEGRHYSRGGEVRSGEVLLKVTIPWFNRDKYHAAVNRDRARAAEIENRIDDYIYGLRAEVHHMVSNIENAREEALLYRDEIIPRSTLALRSAEAAWTANRDGFRDVLEARRMLVEARSSYYKAVAEQYKNMAEVVLRCGLGDLEALEMLGSKMEE